MVKGVIYPNFSGSRTVKNPFVTATACTPKYIAKKLKSIMGILRDILRK
jgi:hypothetical protein